MQNNRNILIVILIVLVGVFVLMYNNKSGGLFHKETTGEKISNSVNEITEEIGDEIDDNTTTK